MLPAATSAAPASSLLPPRAGGGRPGPRERRARLPGPVVVCTQPPPRFSGGLRTSASPSRRSQSIPNALALDSRDHARDSQDSLGSPIHPMTHPSTFCWGAGPQRRSAARVETTPPAAAPAPARGGATETHPPGGARRPPTGESRGEKRGGPLDTDRRAPLSARSLGARARRARPAVSASSDRRVSVGPSVEWHPTSPSPTTAFVVQPDATVAPLGGRLTCDACAT